MGSLLLPVKGVVTMDRQRALPGQYLEQELTFFTWRIGVA